MATPKFTPEEEAARTAAGQAARAEAIKAGKSPAVADAIALDVYMKWTPPATEPEGDSYQRHYEAMGEAVLDDYRGFASYLRDLADKGELVGADGKPLPMYSKEKIAGMSLDELKKLVAGNPRYARQYFKEPTPEVAAMLEGTGRTGIGKESGMVELPPVPAAPAPAPAPATAAPAPAPTPVADDRGYGDRTREFEEAESNREPMVPTEPSPKAEPQKKKKFGEMAGELYNKYGVPFLEIVEAVGKQRGGIDKPTMLDKKYAEKLEQQQRDYAKKLEEEKAAREEASYAKRIADQRAWEEAQAKAARDYEAAQTQAGYGQQEKLLKMQLEAQRAAARAGGGTAAPIIPD